MDDNLAPFPDRDRGGPPRLRNIDPSMLRERTEDDGWRRFDGPSYWVAQRPGIAARTPAETLAWLDSLEDILDGPDNIEVTSPDGRPWLVLTGFETWRNGPAFAISESWRRIGSLIVRGEDRGAALYLLADQQLTENHALPVADSGRYDEHLGEFPWAWPGENVGGWQENWRPFGADWEITKGVTIRPVTAEYIAEARGYNGSISENINVHLPAKWLMAELGLILSDGRSIEYRNAAGVTLFLDPPVAHQGRSAALVDRQAFLDLLARGGLVATWAIAGEKNAYGDVHSEAFGGRHTFTRLFYSEGDEIRARDRLDLFESPTPRHFSPARQLHDRDLDEARRKKRSHVTALYGGLARVATERASRVSSIR